MKRRTFLKASGASFASLALPLPAAHLRSAFGDDEPRPTLVVVYLRGGADPLNMVVPYSDDRYYELRTTIAIPPEDTAEGPGVLRLDRDFGLHPAMSSLMPYWEDEKLAPILNVGSPHPTRSHFDAQDFMEYAAPGMRTVRNGWLNRFLSASDREGEGSDLRALAMQGLLPRSLRGSYTALAVPEERVLGDEELLDLYGPLYGGSGGAMEPRREGEDSLIDAGRDTFETLERFREIVGRKEGRSRRRGRYPDDGLGSAMRDLARVIRSGAGLEVAALDVGGWDTHAGQGGATGSMANRLRSLADALAAFMGDIGPHARRTLVMVMTEFGRTCRENGNSGTDHGHGSAMFLLGGSVAGGRVHGKWTGLEEANLYQRRDLEVTTDFRDVFGEVLREHFRFDAPKDFFPEYSAGRVRKLFA
ncbi:MAG: DUF1501 domain-containing protein [Planctomycetota bacterium]|jgi:uncharacterized protein (DUF1501 family)|nr:DUF1501 domain-containing protein [Planctomycetota bacterium]MDP6763594.1 DUF1501 domain-containing protein [Planctomycetota bacterium]MDP6988457.1 DUF1501 domain-containing protein [Planctomycetota bacterium]